MWVEFSYTLSHKSTPPFKPVTCTISDISRWFYLSEAVGCEVQRVEQSAVLQTLHICQVVVRAAQVEQGVNVPQSFGADQLVVIHRQPLQALHRLQTSYGEDGKCSLCISDKYRTTSAELHLKFPKFIFHVPVAGCAAQCV